MIVIACGQPIRHSALKKAARLAFLATPLLLFLALIFGAPRAIAQDESPPVPAESAGASPASDVSDVSDASEVGDGHVGERRADSNTGPDAVPNLLREEEETKSNLFDVRLFDNWFDAKKRFAEDSGLSFAVDYNVLAYKATDSVGKDDASTGVARFLAKWDLFGRGTADTGGVVFKFENRTAYGGTPPSDLGFELGYVGLLNCCFSDQGWRTTNLYWRQSVFDSRWVTYAGFLDVTDYMNVYAMASPWTGFSNLVFATGSGSIGGLPDGAFGVMSALWATENLYVIGSVVDANADPTDLNVEGFFEDFETLKSLDIIWTPDRKSLLFNNIQVTLYQIDDRNKAGTKDGYGVSFSVSFAAGSKFLPFLRGGWGKDGNSLLEGSVSAGVGYQTDPDGALLGAAFNWGRPNDGTFGTSLDDQYTAEIFYRAQVFEFLQVTPSIQFLVDPALNPDEDFVAVFGLRTRASF